MSNIAVLFKYFNKWIFWYSFSPILTFSPNIICYHLSCQLRVNSISAACQTSTTFLSVWKHPGTRLAGRLVLGKIVSLSFQWPGEPHSQAGNVCFAWKVRSLSRADLLVRVWRSAGFYCILTCNDGVMGRWDQASYQLISNVKYSWFRQQRRTETDYYFYLIIPRIPRTESHSQWFSVHQYIPLYFP